MISKLLVFFAMIAAAQTPGVEAQIKSVLDRQVVDWNRGDTEGFLLGYDPKTIFVGEKITRGLDQVRVRYQTHYPTRASMGTLTFSDIEVHMLGPTSAFVIGRWRLERSQEAGGDTGGVYSLLFRKTEKGWKI